MNEKESDLPFHVLDEAKKMGLKREDKPVILENGIVVRNPLHDWDQICGNNENKKQYFQNEGLFVTLTMRALENNITLPFNDIVQLTTMGELWNQGVKIISDLYDEKRILFRLWIELNEININGEVSWIYIPPLSLGAFKRIHGKLGSKKIKSFINQFREVLEQV